MASGPGDGGAEPLEIRNMLEGAPHEPVLLVWEFYNPSKNAHSTKSALNGAPLRVSMTWTRPLAPRFDCVGHPPRALGIHLSQPVEEAEHE